MNYRFILTILILCGVALSMVLSVGRFGDVLKKPLFDVTKEHKANFHTPVFSSGYPLPTHITGTVHLSPEQGVVTISGISTIEKNGELIIEPGTTVAANEYASIVVRGKMEAIGNASNPIHFISNETREENRTWSGILFTEESAGSIHHAIFHHASPGISCDEKTRVTISDTTFALGNLDVFGPCSYTP